MISRFDAADALMASAIKDFDRWSARCPPSGDLDELRYQMELYVSASKDDGFVFDLDALTYLTYLMSDKAQQVAELAWASKAP